MKRHTKAALWGSVALAALAVNTPVIAQEITSAVRGTVTAPDGSPVVGETVTITDTRTGRSRNVVTNNNGNFSARGLTVGGPYTVRVSSDRYQDTTITDIILNLSGAAVLNIGLEEAGSDIEEITVTASASVVSNLTLGPGTAFNLSDIEAQPSISRQIRDIIRLDPRVNIARSDGGQGFQVNCLGGEGRTNSFTIDGIRSADGFGLNASGNSARNTFPIPFDTVASTAVEFSPVDVEYGQFTGCNINVVTKSGTNDFSGSAFFLYTGDSIQGDTVDGVQTPQADFDNFNWGAELGGPIIKDKLFFYGSYEETDAGGTQDEGPVGAGFGVGEDFIDLDDANTIQNILINQFDRDPGFIVRNLPNTSRRFFGRLDWNITDYHRLEASYTRLEEQQLESDDLGPFGGFTFSDNFEIEGTESDAYRIGLYSDWTENFSTEIRVSRIEVTDLQDPFGGGEAQDENPIERIQVLNGDLTFSGSDDPTDILFTSGPGLFRSANALEFTIDQIKIAGDYVVGDHTITIGYELDNLSVFNLFAPESTGTFTFASITDLQAGIVSDIEATGSFTGDINDAAAEFTRNIHSIYLQDEWQATDRLILKAGLRYDFYQSDDQPIANPIFQARYGFSNTQAFQGLDILQPRIGLTYDLPEDTFGETTLTAGFGIFSGGDPTVFFSNAFTNFGGALGDGLLAGAGCTPEDAQVLQNGQFTGLPQCIIDQQIAAATQNTGRVDAVDPDLELPSQWRYSIGLAHVTDFGSNFFDNWNVRADLIYSDRRNSLDTVDLTLTPVGVAPDGRPIFNAIDPLLPGCDARFIGPREGFVNVTDACDAGFDDQDTLLTNDINGSGRTINFSIQANKDFEITDRTFFNFNIGYSYLDSTIGNRAGSSTATSNFEEVAVAVLNQPQIAASPDANRHNFVISGVFEHDFIEDHSTTLGFFFRAREGRPFSFTFDGDTGEDFFGDTDDEERILFYVPTGPNDPLFDSSQLSAEDQAAFFNFLDTSGLSEFAGQIAPRNAFRQPWTTDLDIRLTQEIPTPFEGHKLEFILNFENFLNFLGSGGNVQRFADNGAVGEAVPVGPATIVDNGDGTSSFVLQSFNPGGGNSAPFGFDPFNDIDNDDSLWRIQLGIRYKF